MAYASISKPGLHFNTKLYTGNGSTQSITGVGFQPDFIWLKERSAAGNHKVNDVIRGTSKYLSSNSTAVEDTTGAGIQSYDSDGFSISNASDINDNTETYVAWNWKAGGTTSSNTDGDINSTVSVNTTAGFSIVSYTGNGSNNQTVGHGLGVKPAVMIFKNRDDTNNWVMYHHKLNNGTNPEVKYVELNTNNGQLDDASIFNDTAPTSTLFTIGSASDTGGGSGGNNEKIIAYCFAEKTGYSKFGSYVANNNADGTFVYTGFKPSFLMIKALTGAGQNWIVVDNKRPGYNLISAADSLNLRPNTNDAEATSNGIDLLSNGFKCRSSDGDSNGNYTDPYIYMAFAEEPLVANVGTNGIPATAE